jgi:hypothetical protein
MDLQTPVQGSVPRISSVFDGPPANSKYLFAWKPSVLCRDSNPTLDHPLCVSRELVPIPAVFRTRLRRTAKEAWWDLVHISNYIFRRQTARTNNLYSCQTFFLSGLRLTDARDPTPGPTANMISRLNLRKEVRSRPSRTQMVTTVG